jgi:5-oxoprolinase (ATP-hydrolysing) subunit A
VRGAGRAGAGPDRDHGGVDLNADLGEGFGVWRLTDDEGLLDVVTSANLACGFHAGDPLGLRRVAALAAERGVTVGAQVSYRDLFGFGRRFLDVAPEELEAEVVYQVGALDALCRVEGTSVRYLKPHGALYHACLTHPGQGNAVRRAAAATGLPLLHGWLEGAVKEGFVDRGYRQDGSLVPRGEPGDLLDEEAAVAQAVRLSGQVASLCVHGDAPGAVALARRVRSALEEAGVVLAPFV